ASKAGAELAQPWPHMVLDVLPEQTLALKKQGYELRSLPVPRVWFLGINHRRAPLGDANVRLALAHAVDRQGLLKRHFAGDPGGASPQTVNGLFPRGSWALGPPQRGPAEL